MDEERYKKLKKEFVTPSFRDKMTKEVGCKCYNCGVANSDSIIEYHHVVPLVLGGTNSMSNIVALCRDCHLLAHGAKDVKKRNREPGRMGGRPRFKPREDYKKNLDMFIRGKIGKSECQKLVGMKAGKLNDMDFYHDYLGELGIIHIRNLVDFHKIKGDGSQVLSYVIFKDGTRIDYLKSGEEIKSVDMATVVKCQEKQRKKRSRVNSFIG